MVVVELEVVEIYTTTVGNIYSIAFPVDFIPVAGHTFWAANRCWKVAGVAFSLSERDVPERNMRDYILLPREHQLGKGIHQAQFD